MSSRRVIGLAMLAVVLGLGMTGVAAAIPTVIKDSAEFTYIYDFGTNENPTDPTQVDEDANGVGDWAFISGTVSMSGGSLAIANGKYLESRTAGQLWPYVGFTMSDAFTVEVRVKIVSDYGEPGDYGEFGLGIEPAGAPQTQPSLFVSSSGEWWRGSTTTSLGTAINNDDFHVFRVVKEAGSNSWWVWRDGIPLNLTALVPPTGTYGDTWVYAGDYTGSLAGTSQLDYIRLIKGAFAPLPEPAALTLLLFGAPALLLLRRRKPEQLVV